MIEVVGDNEFVIIPEPATNDHVPTPTVAVLAVITVVGEEIQSVCVIPAFETVGTSFTTSVTFETEDKHGIFEIVQANTLFPKPKPVMIEFGEVGLVIVPLPETRVHIPVPIVVVLAVIVVVGEEIQSVCVVPAFDGVGRSFTRIETVDELAEHGLFEIVHSKIFKPKPKPVIEVVGDNELVIVPEPEINDQVPTPTVAVLAFIKAFGLVIQTV